MLPATPLPSERSANIPVINIAGAAVSVAVDPNSRLLYIGETAAISGSNSGGLRVFNYSTLAEVTGSPFATGGLAPYAIVAHPLRSAMQATTSMSPTAR